MGGGFNSLENILLVTFIILIIKDKSTEQQHDIYIALYIAQWLSVFQALQNNCINN